MPLDMEERARRSIMYKTLDKLLEESHGGDYMGMHKWIMSQHCSEQFSSKFRHDQFITDFVNWSKNRGISYE